MSVQPNTKQMLGLAGNRLGRLVELDAPDVVVFTEVRLIERRFEKWCRENGIDPDADEFIQKAG